MAGDADSRLLGTDTHLLGADSRSLGADTHILGADSRFFGADLHLLGADTHLIGADSRLLEAESLLHEIFGQVHLNISASSHIAVFSCNLRHHFCLFPLTKHGSLVVLLLFSY